MSDQGFSLATTTEALLALSVRDAIGESKKAECWSYGQVFFGRAKAAEAGDDNKSAIAWRLLGQLSQIKVEEGNPNEPFRPMFENATGRSVLPCDLDEVTARAVLELARATEDAELRAKLFDICWDRLRDVEAARMAVRSYIEAADRLFDPDHWVQYVQRIERALRLARQIRDEDLQKTILDAIEGRVIALEGRDPLYMTSRLMELLHEFKHADPAVMCKIAAQAAKVAEGQKDFDRARAHLENVQRWARRGGDKDAERNARVAIAASYVSQADLHSGPGGELAAAHFLESAHEAYRAIPGMRDKAEEVYGQLRQQQIRARDAMQEITSEGIDLSPVIKAARERVSGKPFREALLAFATVTHPTDFDQETENTRKIIERFPLQSLLGGALIDGDGRIVAHRTPGLIADEKQQEQHLWERLVEQVTMGYQINVEAEIIPGMNQLAFEHSVSIGDMRDLV
ncbi:MAG TPA: hypothetical protein DD670_02445, partial [Planctomycetaceae bacterium]|nr:hypothetical protein [Planctomycetaceae bacterium]